MAGSNPAHGSRLVFSDGFVISAAMTEVLTRDLTLLVCSTVVFGYVAAVIFALIQWLSS
jgi:hypothetical protein